MKTALKTLTFLSGILALSVAAPISAQADMNATTSTLVISNEVYIPSDDATVEVLTSETDMMPITNDVASDHSVPHLALKATTAPQTLTPMPHKNLVVETSAVQPIIKAHENIALSWRARRGENLQDVISRWGGRAEQSFTWKTQDTAQIHRNFSYFGTYSGAVEKLLKRETKSADYFVNYTHNTGNRITGLKKND